MTPAAWFALSGLALAAIVYDVIAHMRRKAQRDRQQWGGK